MEIDIEKLLYLIEERGPIYNYKNKDHSNKIIIDTLWNEIAKELKCQVYECKGKWTSLRNSYARYLREERSKPYGFSSKRKKKWYLADAMSFMKPYINQQRNTSSGLESQQLEYSESKIMKVDPLIPNEDESTQSSTSSLQNSPINSPIPRKKFKTLVSEMVAEPSIEFLQSNTKEQLSESSGGLFFRSLLSDYEKLSSKHQRAFKLHMLKKMTEFQEDEENEADNGKSLSVPTRLNLPTIQF